MKTNTTHPTTYSKLPNNMPNTIKTRINFGLKSSMPTFCRFTYLARLIMLKNGFEGILVYVTDDFLVIAPTKQECEKIWNALNNLLNEFPGLALVCTKPNKRVPPHNIYSWESGSILMKMTME